MKGRGRWLLVLLGMIVLLLIGAITAATTQESDPLITAPLDAHSPRPTGALALFLWTQRLGRGVEYLEYERFELGTEDSLFVSLQPFTPYSKAEIETLLGWLRGGGTLLLATDMDSALLDELGIPLENHRPYTSARLAQPLQLQPPVRTVTAPSGGALKPAEGVTVLVSSGANEGPVLVRRDVGRGTAWVLAMPRSLSNEQIAEADNSELYVNVLSRSRPGGVVFDEYHHGKPGAVSLRELIYTTPWGCALMYTAALLLLYTALRGKRLGRPLRPDTSRNRNAGEYVRSLASLLRSADRREYITEHYTNSWRRSIQQAAGLPSETALGDLARAAEENTGVPATPITEAMKALETREPDRKRVLALVRAAEQQRKKMKRRNR